MRGRRRLDELIDPERLRSLESEPSPARLRSLLPRGWVPEPDGVHARRDGRIFFREGWILVLCLVVFGALAVLFLLGGTPRGWAGILRILALVAAVWIAGGLAAPLVTRALRRR